MAERYALSSAIGIFIMAAWGVGTDFIEAIP
jgi:hypothetical protein